MFTVFSKWFGNRMVPILSVTLMIVLMVSFFATAGLRDRSSLIELYGSKNAAGNYIYFPEISSAPSTPASGWGAVSVRGNDIYFIDDAGAETSMIGAGGTGVANLDEAYDGGGAGAGHEIAVDQDEVLLTGTNAGNNVLGISNSGTGNLINLTNTGSGKDIDGTGSTWSFTAAGLLTLENGLTIDNAANGVLELNEAGEDLLVTFDTNLLDLSSTTGILQVDLFDGVATTLTKAADGADDDFTISVTGAQDSSLKLASSGTAADAISLITSAGGIDITVAGGAAGEDIDITTDTSINLATTEDAASTITLVANGGTSETIVVTNTQGTSDASIDVNATAGGIDMDAGKSITITSAEAQADAIVISASTAVGGIDITSNADIDITTTGAAAEDITIDNSGGSVNIIADENQVNAIVIDAENAAGGIDVDAGTGGITVDITGAADFRVDSSAGSIVLVGAQAAVDAITIDAENGAGGLDMDFGTGAMTLTGTGVAANLTIDADALSLDCTDSSNITVTSSAGAEDLTISQVGANDSSILVTAAGTGADAVSVIATAGEVDITSALNLDLTATAAVNISGSLVNASIQDIAAGGTTTVAVLTNQVFTVGADAGGDIVTLAAGTAGQIVYFICEDESGVTTITPSTFNGGSSITFDALGDSVTLIYTAGTGWSIVGGNSYTII